MKKILSIISIMLIAAILCGTFGAAGVSAVKAEYTSRDVNAYVFTLDNTKTITCLFRDDLPDVPYISPIDYLNVIYTDEFTMQKNEDGTYTVTNAYGKTMVIDAAADTIYVESFDDFMNCVSNQEGSSEILDFILIKGVYHSVDPFAITIDLASYNIDIAEADGIVYLPLTVIAAMFSVIYNNACYIDGTICFVHTMDPESYIYEYDKSSLFQSMTRTQEAADFNYSILCLFMDKFYGRPSNAIMANAVSEKGLDKALDDFDDLTPRVKELLKSTDMVTYFHGLTILSYYFFDGGHTILYYPAIISTNVYGEEPLSKAWSASFFDDEDELGSLAYEYYEKQVSTYDFDDYIYGIRETEYEKYKDEIVKEYDSGAYLMIHGDMAVFVFDSFELETPTELKDALDTAKENGVINFLIDDSCNGGGYVASCEFILSMILNEKYRSADLKFATEDPLTGSIYVSYDIFDLNLDGVFDEADCDVYYDFNFAILESHSAFSCGNLLPVMAGYYGIMILGEPSGGGSCCVTERYLADGYYYNISDNYKYTTPDGADVDLGAPTDYDLRVLNEGDGTYDYTGFYDFDHISELMSGFYKTVKFLDDEGNVIRSGRYRVGDEIVVPEPVRASEGKYDYKFISWDKEIETVCTGDAVYVASFEAVERFIPGDVSGDGTADNKDVVTLFRCLSGEKVNVNVSALDVNGDGTVDNKDVVTLFRVLSGDPDTVISQIPYVPAEEPAAEAA